MVVKIVVFDKIGILIKGIFKVIQVVIKNGFFELELLILVVKVEFYFIYFIVLLICEVYVQSIVDFEVVDYEEIVGYGI